MTDEKRGPGNLPGENGRRTTLAQRQKRQLDAVKLLEMGLSKAEICRLLDVDDTTLWRTLKDIDEAVIEVKPETVDLYRAYRERERMRLEELRQVTLNGSMSEDKKLQALLAIHDRLKDMLGLGGEQYQPVPVPLGAPVWEEAVVKADAEPEVVDTIKEEPKP
jgi:hypothetical protein